MFDFALDSLVPVMINFSEDYVALMFHTSKPSLILFTEAKDSYYQKVFAEAAKELRGEILFVQSGVTNDVEDSLVQLLGINKVDLP